MGVLRVLFNWHPDLGSGGTGFYISFAVQNSQKC